MANPEHVEIVKQGAQAIDQWRGHFVCRTLDLTWGDLTDENLTGANLRDAKLTDAFLTMANLTDVNLTGADLTGIRLYKAIGNGKEIHTIQTDQYHVNIVLPTRIIWIDCIHHTVDDWFCFSDEEIEGMELITTIDAGFLTWWKIWKPILQSIVEAIEA